MLLTTSSLGNGVGGNVLQMMHAAECNSTSMSFVHGK